jgi:hypothetical protein
MTRQQVRPLHGRAAELSVHRPVQVDLINMLAIEYGCWKYGDIPPVSTTRPFGGYITLNIRSDNRVLVSDRVRGSISSISRWF